MTEHTAQLLNWPGVVPPGPADPDAVAAVSDYFNADLPADLLDLWAVSNGLPLDAVQADLLGPRAAMELVQYYAAEDGLLPVPSARWLPLLSDRQSNLLVLATRGPLASRVFHLDHEGMPFRPLFRDVPAFLLDLLALLKTHAEGHDEYIWAESYYSETLGNYPPDGPRTPDDHAAARALLAAPNANESWTVAAKLLPATDVVAFARLLETDHFTRREVRQRIERSRDPALLALLARDAADFDTFARALTDAATAAGLPVRELQGDSLRIGKGWKNLDWFFHRRHAPDALRRMVDWFRDQQDGRNPYDRPGHIMQD